MIWAVTTNEYHWALDLQIWSGVIFVLLMTVLFVFVAPGVGQAMRRRQQSIVENVRQAEVALAEIEQIREKQKAERRRMRQQAAELLQEARADAQRMRQEMLEKAKGEADRIKQRVQRDTALVSQKAVHELWATAAELSIQVARRILQTQLDPTDQKRLVEDSIREIGAAAEVHV